MQYLERVRTLQDDPQALEQLYRAAAQRGEVETFQTAIEQIRQSAPESPLLDAWHYRLQLDVPEARDVPGHWKAAVPLSVLTGLLFWALSDVNRLMVADYTPYLTLVWAPLAAILALVFLTWTGKEKSPLRLGVLSGILLAVSAYVVWAAPTLLSGPHSPDVGHYITLAIPHLPLLAWGALGVLVLGLGSAAAERFAFLIKSVEVVITAGLFLTAGVAFTAITVGLFSALGVEISEMMMRLIVAGGFGLLPILALATVYDPTRTPLEQDFSQGLSRFVHTLMRLMLIPTLVVLAIYIVFIPSNFMQPFLNRDVLLVYNVMLFAVMGLLLGALPVQVGEISARMRLWLRRGMVTVAGLALVVSVYAMAAIVYRTATMGGITMNRLTVIGWNSINITLLGMLLYRQAGRNEAAWIEEMQHVFALGTNAYLVWTLLILLGIPLLF